jgi:ribosomal protein S15P/S13E
MNLSKYRFEEILKRVYFTGGGFFSSGASSDQKKEYIKAVFDDAFDRYSKDRDLVSLEEWNEIKSHLISNKKDIISEKDIEILAKVIEEELR